MSSIAKFHLICVIALALCALAVAQLSATAASNNAQRYDTRGRDNPYYNDATYNNRYFRNRDYYNNRQYYDNLFKKYNPAIAAPQARIIAQDVDLKHDGTYKYSYETENGIQFEERGAPVKTGSGEQKEVVEGSYSYVSPDGTRVIVKYTADENGYHPTITYDGGNAERFSRVQQPADIVITRQN